MKIIPRICEIAVPLPRMRIPLSRGSADNLDINRMRSELTYVFNRIMNFSEYSGSLLMSNSLVYTICLFKLYIGTSYGEKHILK